jgi:hypothetical protein
MTGQWGRRRARRSSTPRPSWTYPWPLWVFLEPQPHFSPLPQPPVALDREGRLDAIDAGKFSRGKILEPCSCHFVPLGLVLLGDLLSPSISQQRRRSDIIFSNSDRTPATFLTVPVSLCWNSHVLKILCTVVHPFDVRVTSDVHLHRAAAVTWTTLPTCCQRHWPPKPLLPFPTICIEFMVRYLPPLLVIPSNSWYVAIHACICWYVGCVALHAPVCAAVQACLHLFSSDILSIWDFL